MTSAPGIGSRRAATAATPVAWALLALAIACVPARAAGAPQPAWVSFGLASGSTAPDAHLADYQWDVTPHVSWGASALVGRGRFATGLRLWRSQARQMVDPSLGLSPAVRSTSLEVVGRGRFAGVLGCGLYACASAGRQHLGWAPDRLTLTTGSGPVTVDLGAVNGWIGGGGIAIQRTLPRHWAVDFEVDRRVYGLDTAHRSGSGIVNQRESFGDWSARLEFARVFPLTVKGISR